MSAVHKAVITIDQGTTSTRAIVFDSVFAPVFTAQEEYPQHYPQPGWVEHNPEDIWQTTVSTLKQTMAYCRENAIEIAGIGLVNQRETTLVWDRETGKTLYPAIVWQDRRTAHQCHKLKHKEEWLHQRTGLRCDPYFSATKICWILDNVPHARERAEAGELAFGTIDSFLIWRLTGGKQHLTDTTNASRTNLFNINDMNWDNDLLALFDVPASLLPEVKNCADDFGKLDASEFGESIPICGVAGDQQAALIGQGCYKMGEAKTTFGTGCFALVNSGSEPAFSEQNLLTTVAYTLNGETCYAMEGSIFVAGAAIQWLRDSLGILPCAADSEKLARQVEEDHQVVVVPAFTGLGAPYWEPLARGAIFGLTRGSTAAHVVRATLESVSYQTQDLLNAMRCDGIDTTTMNVDGGMVQNSWFCQFLANTLNITVNRPKVMETTALGAAYLAGLHAGLKDYIEDFAALNPQDSTFEPEVDDILKKKRQHRWQAAVKATLIMAEAEANLECD